MKPKVVYVCGTSYCGSSLLNLLLDGAGGAGHEWGNQKRLLLAGWRIAVDWGARPRRWKSRTEWRRAGEEAAECGRGM